RFGSSLATQLTGALRHASELRVVDSAPDVMVLGNVDRAAGHLLVTARLVRTANRYQLWAHTYEFDPPGDSAALAQTIATAVRAVLHIRPDRCLPLPRWNSPMNACFCNAGPRVSCGALRDLRHLSKRPRVSASPRRG